MRIKKITRAVTGLAGSYDNDTQSCKNSIYVICFSGFYLQGYYQADITANMRVSSSMG